MKVICCGSRSWTDSFTIRCALATYPDTTTVVHGASPGGGADLLADEAARRLGFTVVRVPIADIDRRRARSRRQAPILRNLRMLDEHPDADRLEAFWDGKSPGTRHMIGEARRRGLLVTVTIPQRV